MSNSGNRKSMDDVLASIRRIVRSDVPPNEEEGTQSAHAEREQTPPAPMPEEEPLDLTQDMRLEDTRPADPLENMADRLESRTSDYTATDYTMDQPGYTPPEPTPIPAPPAAAAPAGLPFDEATLEQMIRDVIKDELVNGDIGRNISQNVQRMIQDEIARAMKG